MPSPVPRAILRDMVKLWWVMWYFIHYDGETDTSLPSWYDGKKLKRGYLKFYLIFNKHFREDFRDTLERWVYTRLDKQIPHSDRRKIRIQNRFQELDDIIDKAISKNLLIPQPSAPNVSKRDIYLECDFRGREFIKPLHFINEFAKEYGPTKSLLAGTGFGAISLALLQYFIGNG